MRQGAQGWCTWMTLRDGMGKEVERVSGLGTHVHPRLIHVHVWQKPLQCCKVISLQLKLKKKKSAFQNQYCQNDYTTLSNLHIQCNPYQITNGNVFQQN